MSLAVALTVALSATVGRADEPCRAPDGRGGAFVTCFDPGNRLRLDATSAGVGASVDLRQRVASDDPRIHYRLEHSIAGAKLGSASWGVAAYSLRFVRHSENGYLVVPTNPPRQLSLPFDFGIESSFLRLEGPRHEASVAVGVVRIALLADFARSSDGRFRFAVGPAMRWDATFDRRTRTTVENDVAPFTVGAISAYAESSDGLTLARLSAEIGGERFAERGFSRVAHAELAIERVVFAINDHPFSLYAAGRYDDPGAGLGAEVGIRFAALGRRR